MSGIAGDDGSKVGVIIGLLVLVGIVVFWSLPGITGADRDAAEREAKAFCSGMGYKAPRVSCARLDSDGDGYVSCTVSEEDGSRLLALECAKKLTINDGCRIQKPGVRVQVTR